MHLGPANRGIKALGLVTAAAVPAVVFWCGCGHDARLAGQKIRSPKVGTVTHYGVTLDRQAAPEQVAFVALRAIREDVSAKTDAERQAALDKQFDLCAANVLAAKNVSSLPRDEFIHSVVYHWAPTVAHYVGDFETEWEKASARCVRRESNPAKESKGGATEAEIAMQVRDPGGDPNASVVLLVWLAQDEGYWRVTHLGFDPTRRTMGN